MKTIIGTAIGVFAIGLVLIGAGWHALASTAPAAVPSTYALPADGNIATAQPVAYRPDVSYLPAASSRPVQHRTVTERRVVYQEAAARRVAPAKRSVTKRLLVIGGSTAAGAGIGGLIGGGKGALIGAALGGGASTIYEATRR